MAGEAARQQLDLYLGSRVGSSAVAPLDAEHRAGLLLTVFLGRQVGSMVVEGICQNSGPETRVATEPA